MNMRRPANWVTGVCLGGSAVLAVLAILDLATVVRLDAVWAYVTVAVLLPIVAYRSGALERRAFGLATTRQAQRELLQGQLDQQRRSVDALADGLDIAIFICDERAHVLYANLRARDMFGFADPIGRSLLAVTLSYELERVILAADRNQSAERAEIAFGQPAERVGIAKAWPQSDVRGRVFLSLYEVTDLRRLERIRQDFVANVSHELRTPMTLIRAMAETLLDETDGKSELAERYLLRTIDEVDRLSSLTEDLLILSAAELQVVEKHSCDLAEIVKDVVGRLADRAHAKGLEYGYSGPDHLMLQANPTQMTQVALNLVENAINYTSEGSVSVCLYADHLAAVLEVSDTGIGIASEHQKRVFERFYRVDKGRSRLSGGTGLGLSIVKHIVEAHGGTVSLESVLNNGSTVRAAIPVGHPALPE